MAHLLFVFVIINNNLCVCVCVCTSLWCDKKQSTYISIELNCIQIGSYKSIIIQCNFNVLANVCVFLQDAINANLYDISVMWPIIFSSLRNQGIFSLMQTCKQNSMILHNDYTDRSELLRVASHCCGSIVISIIIIIIIPTFKFVIAMGSISRH